MIGLWEDVLDCLLFSCLGHLLLNLGSAGLQLLGFAKQTVLPLLCLSGKCGLGSFGGRGEAGLVSFTSGNSVIELLDLVLVLYLLLFRAGQLDGTVNKNSSSIPQLCFQTLFLLFKALEVFMVEGF